MKPDLRSPSIDGEAHAPAVPAAERRRLFDAVPLGLYRSTAEGRIVDANPALVQMLGYPDEASLLAASVDQLYVDSEERCRRREQIEREGGVRRFPIRLRRRDGSVRRFEDSARAVPEGERVFHEGVLEELAEDRLGGEQQARLTAILEATPDFVGIGDRDRRIVYLNRAGRAMLGIGAAEDVSGTPIADLKPAWANALIEEEAIPTAIRKGSWSGEAALRTRDGRTILVSQVIVAHKGPDGELAFLSTIARDIGERKRAEEMIRRQAEFSERLIDSSVDGIVAFDRECRITIWNATMEQATRLPEAQTLGRSILDLLPFLRETGDDRLFLDALEGGTVVAKDRPFVLPDGRRGLFEGHFSPLRGEQGAVVGGLAIIREVTERRALEEQLRQSQKMEAVGRLAGGVAHDFNNMLTVISGYTELLLLGLGPGDARQQYGKELLSATDKASALTQQLLAFSRRQVLHPRVLDLNAAVADLQGLLRRLIGEDIELVIEPGRDLWPVQADPSQIEQVLMNLAVNAREAMPAGGRLVIATGNVLLDAEYARLHVDSAPGPHVLLSVTDAGVGMDAETIARIFEPFFTTKSSGTGLGLATVYGIVKQSGGQIAVESELGRGTSFRIHLPKATPLVDAPHSEPLAAPRGGSETILVVEDEDGVRDLARLILESYGYSVLHARSAGEALRIVEMHPAPIHLLLADVVLPGMSGPLVAESVARRRPETRVTFMSGYPEEAIGQHGLPREGARLLRKPFTPEALARRVRDCLDATVSP